MLVILTCFFFVCKCAATSPFVWTHIANRPEIEPLLRWRIVVPRATIDFEKRNAPRCERGRVLCFEAQHPWSTTAILRAVLCVDPD
jgi:hypothetical protein